MNSERDILSFGRWDDDFTEEKPSFGSSFHNRCITLPKKKAPSLDTPEALATIVEKLARTVQARTETELKIGLIEKVVLELRHKVLAMETHTAVTVAINTFAPEPLVLKRPIWITIQPEGDEFSAIFFDANMSTTGDTQFEAIENLKDLIINNYTHFLSLEDNKLGPGPRKQLAVLRTLIK